MYCRRIISRAIEEFNLTTLPRWSMLWSCYPLHGNPPRLREYLGIWNAVDWVSIIIAFTLLGIGLIHRGDVTMWAFRFVLSDMSDMSDVDWML